MNAIARLHLAARQNAYVLATAKNIAVKYARGLHRLHSSSDGGVPVDVPLNSGLLTVEGSADVSVG